MAATAFAQRASGVITGRVVADDGQPIRHATINIAGVGGGVKRALAGRLAIVTDEEGNFQADGLDSIPYVISAMAPGYVLAPNSRVKSPYDTLDPAYSFVGQSVTIMMTRGGVITGKVTNAAGEPVIGVAIKATRVRDEAGHPATETGVNFQPERTTDDRGVYRIYGLAPGAYIVAAGGSSQGFSLRPSPFGGRMAAFHPSSTRDTAAEVKVAGGDEASGIDIRYRGERGFAISGNVTGAPAGAQGGMRMDTTIIWLRNPATGAALATAFQLPVGEQKGYAFYGVPNGEYEVVAAREGLEGEYGMASAPRRVTLAGRDVTGIDLALTANASIAGAAAIEKSAPNAQKCESSRESYLEELVLKARRDEPNEKIELLLPVLGGGSAGVPGDKGAFTIRNLKPGRHRIETQLPDEGWYLKAMAMTPANPANPVGDPRNGLVLKAGERVTGLSLTIATSAASLKGKVAAAEKTKLPARLRVHVLPAEVESKDDLLRFSEVPAESDGSFSFANLAPGKYLLVARAVPEAEPIEKPARPAAWDTAERMKLRKEAEAANVAVELKACQRVTEFLLRLAK